MATEWITIQDLLDEYSSGDIKFKGIPYLKDPVTGEIVVNEVKVNVAITTAREDIESYLKAAKVPTDPTPDSVIRKIKECIFNITRFHYSDLDGTLNSDIEKRYDRCMKSMKEIVAGNKIVWEGPNGDTNGGIQQIPLFRG